MSTPPPPEKIEKIRILKLKTQDYISSRNFPRNIPNKYIPAEPAPHHYQVPIKKIPFDVSASKKEMSSPLRVEVLKKSQPLRIISAENYSVNNQNLPPPIRPVNLEEDTSKLLAIRKNLIDSLDEIKHRSAQKMMTDDFYEPHAEHAKKSGLKSSNFMANEYPSPVPNMNFENDLALERQKNAEMNRQLFDLSNKLRTVEDEKRDLVTELAKFRNILAEMRDNKANDGEFQVKLSDCERKNRVLAEEIDRLRNMQRTWDDKKRSLEDKMVEVSTEIQKMTAALKMKQDQVINLESKLQTFSYAPKPDIKPLEERIAMLATEIQRLQIPNQDLSRENHRLNDSLRVKTETITDLEVKLRSMANLSSSREDKMSYEEKIAMLATENERLNALIGLKNENISSLEMRIRYFENNAPKENLQSLEEKIALLSTEIQRLNGMLSFKQGKIDELEVKIQGVLRGGDEIRNLENKLGLITVENQRLIGQLDGKREEVANLERKVSFLEGRLREFESNGTGNAEELLRMKNALMEINRQFEDLKGKYNDKERENFNNIGILRRNEQEFNDLRNENARLREDIDVLHNDHKDKLHQIEKAKKSHMDSEKSKMINDFQLERETFIREKDGLLRDHHLLKEEIGEIRRSLMVKEEEIVEMERRRQRDIENIRIEIEELNRRRLEELIRDATMKLNAEIENLDRQIKSYKNTILELENKISLLIKENERISVAYDQKMKEIDVLNYRAQNLERVRAQELEQLRNELDRRSSENFEVKIQDIRFQFENEKNNLIAEIKEFQQKCINYENKISYFTIEIERLNHIILDKQEEVDDIRAKFNDANENFRSLKELHLVSHADVKIGAEQAKIEAEIRYLQQKIKEYENENTYLKKELDNYKNFNNRRMLELGEWKERISSGNMFDNPEDLKQSYEEYLRLKKENQELLMQKKMDTENFENRMKEIIIAFESKKTENGELNRLLNNERDERKRTQIQLENLRNELSNQPDSRFMIGFSKESNDNLKIENNELKKQISEMQSRMYSLKEEVGKKNEVLGQRIQEMELAKRKFEEELKKFNSKNSSEEYNTVYTTTSRYV